MKNASYFRSVARKALKGNWVIASISVFIAMITGAIISSGFGNGTDTLSNITLSSETSTNLGQAALASTLMNINVLTVILFIFISGVIKLGLCDFLLKIIDGKAAQIQDLFSQFNRFADGIVMRLLTSLYIFLWSLLFVIPGIIKTYSYALTPYIVYENPDMPINDAITLSKKLMNGNKWRLFCLEFSFLGWRILCSLPLIVIAVLVMALYLGFTTGTIVTTILMILSLFILPCSVFQYIGNVVVETYENTAVAAFYRDLCENKTVIEDAVFEDTIEDVEKI